MKYNKEIFATPTACVTAHLRAYRHFPMEIPSANSACVEVMFNDKFKFIIPTAGIVGGHVLHDTDDTNSRVIRDTCRGAFP